MFVITDEVSGTLRYILVLQCSDEESYSASQPEFVFICFCFVFSLEFDVHFFVLLSGFVVDWDCNGLGLSLHLPSILLMHVPLPTKVINHYHLFRALQTIRVHPLLLLQLHPLPLLHYPPSLSFIVMLIYHCSFLCFP